MTKTPYELRYDLLAMAQAILTENLINERIRLENDWNMRCEETRRTTNATAFPKFPVVPVLDVNEIIEVAKTLKNFVSNSGE